MPSRVSCATLATPRRLARGTSGGVEESPLTAGRLARLQVHGFPVIEGRTREAAVQAQSLRSYVHEVQQEIGALQGQNARLKKAVIEARRTKLARTCLQRDSILQHVALNGWCRARELLRADRMVEEVQELRKHEHAQHVATVQGLERALQACVDEKQMLARELAEDERRLEVVANQLAADLQEEALLQEALDRAQGVLTSVRGCMAGFEPMVV